MRDINTASSAGRKIVREYARLDLGYTEAKQLLELFKKKTEHESVVGAVSETCYAAYLAGLAVGMRKGKKKASA